MIERVYYTINREITIEPCPICGQDPDVIRERSDYDDYKYYAHIKCADCGIQTQEAGYYTHHNLEELNAIEEIAKIWNKLPRNK